MAWGSKVLIVDDQSLAGSAVNSSAVTMNPGESDHVEVEIDPPATPTDEVTVAVYGTLDDSSENWDDVPIFSFNIGNDTDPNKASFIVSNLYKWRLTLTRDGSTDTFTVDAWYRSDGISV
ncbi:MAG: hypothetical protein GY853_01950 [PVC group bacterium]|nr:hypothetical protein [PVC group bacterium]